MGELKVNRKAIRDLLKDPALEKHLLSEAQLIAARAGDGYTASSRIGKNRARGTLSKAAGGG
jgi:hypothetical protein